MLLFRKVIKYLASLKLAVLVISLMALFIAWGTLVESRYQDAELAKRTVYQSWAMALIFFFFSINLIAVMVDRWPWKRRHVSFLLAHAGIIILLLGSVMTYQWGIDGSLRLPLQSQAQHVFVGETQLTLWSSFDGDQFTKISEQEIDFYKHDLSKNPLELITDVGNIAIKAWHPYAIGNRVVRASTINQSGSAIQFMVKNPMMQVSEWIVQSRAGKLATHDFGPARVHLGLDQGPAFPARNEVYLEPGAGQFNYIIYQAKSDQVIKGTLKVNEVLVTPWMGMELKILQYFTQAEEKYEYTLVDHKTDMTVAALKFDFQGQEHWLQLNDVVKLFTDKSVYYLSFAQKRIDLGFSLFLKEFKMDRYPGTQRAATYQSQVQLPDQSQTWISMNEPLKLNGFTFYQASFQQDASGAPIASILSVNYDPGRWLKYLGSLVLSLGVIILFYDRRRSSRVQLAPNDEERV